MSTIETTLTATAQKDKELGGYMGVITCSHKGTTIWKDCTGITRLNEADAQADAQADADKMLEQIKEQNLV